MIERVIETLTPPEAWIKGHMAKTAPTGRVIGAETPGARCWCMIGAAIRAEPETPGVLLHWMTLAILELFPGRAYPQAEISNFNDHPETTHADVLRVLTRARELELARHEANA